MRITEQKLDYFAHFVAKFRNKKVAFKQFQQAEFHDIFADNKKLPSEQTPTKKRN